MTPNAQVQKDRDLTKKQLIIDLKVRYPQLKSKQIAEMASSSEGYVNKVWSIFQRDRVRFRGSPKGPSSLVNLHHFDKRNKITSQMFRAIPLRANNKNGQKVWMNRSVTVTFHKNGTVRIYPFEADWEKKLGKYLREFWHEVVVDNFMATIYEASDDPHVAFAVPEGLVIPKLHVRVEGIGDIWADATPFKNGTVEFRVKPEFFRKIQNVESLSKRQLKVMKTFAVAMNEHVLLIRSLQSVATRLERILTRLETRANLLNLAS